MAVNKKQDFALSLSDLFRQPPIQLGAQQGNAFFGLQGLFHRLCRLSQQKDIFLIHIQKCETEQWV